VPQRRLAFRCLPWIQVQRPSNYLSVYLILAIFFARKLTGLYCTAIPAYLVPRSQRVNLRIVGVGHAGGGGAVPERRLAFRHLPWLQVIHPFNYLSLYFVSVDSGSFSPES
jgi:hypothetical protein